MYNIGTEILMIKRNLHNSTLSQPKSILNTDFESSRRGEHVVDTPGLWKHLFWWVFDVLLQKIQTNTKQICVFIINISFFNQNQFWTMKSKALDTEKRFLIITPGLPKPLFWLVFNVLLQKKRRKIKQIGKIQKYQKHIFWPFVQNLSKS